MHFVPCSQQPTSYFGLSFQEFHEIETCPPCHSTCYMFFFKDIFIYVRLFHMNVCARLQKRSQRPEEARVSTGVGITGAVSHLSSPQQGFYIPPCCFILCALPCLTAKQYSDVCKSQFAYCGYFHCETKSLCKQELSFIFFLISCIRDVQSNVQCPAL